MIYRFNGNKEEKSISIIKSSFGKYNSKIVIKNNNSKNDILELNLSNSKFPGLLKLIYNVEKNIESIKNLFVGRTFSINNMFKYKKFIIIKIINL